MKLKFWINISLILMIPLFLSSIMIAMMSFEWFFNDSGYFATLFLTGKFNRPFCLIFFGIGGLSISVIFTTMTMVMRYAPVIDKFDKALEEAYAAKRKYDAATDKILNDIKP